MGYPRSQPRAHTFGDTEIRLTLTLNMTGTISIAVSCMRR